MEQSLWSANSHWFSQEIPCLLWNRRFITMFTRTHHWPLYWTRYIQSTPSNPLSL